MDKGNKATLRTLSGSILALLPTTSILVTDTQSSTKGYGVLHLLFPPPFSVVLLARDTSGASFTESQLVTPRGKVRWSSLSTHFYILAVILGSSLPLLGCPAPLGAGLMDLKAW